ncbi:hypothetical protein HYV43_00870 [Candidatus Micrarchaeota archaeon]|nr:hypothetical protein [Candidatus Micrarchaeota archaeon]
MQELINRMTALGYAHHVLTPEEYRKKHLQSETIKAQPGKAIPIVEAMDKGQVASIHFFSSNPELRKEKGTQRDRAIEGAHEAFELHGKQGKDGLQRLNHVAPAEITGHRTPQTPDVYAFAFEAKPQTGIMAILKRIIGR